MTNEDKKIISDYMGWIDCSSQLIDRFETHCSYNECCYRCEHYHNFDLNDASLCVQRMVEKGIG